MANIQKFALIGTSSSGKTTLTFDILARLKLLGVLVDGVLQQDRRLCFDRSKLETHPEAQYAVIFNMVVKESELSCKDGVDVIVSDRSVLDFYAYYECMYGRSQYLFDFIKQWCSSYCSLYYLNPLTYQDDGSRPTNSFRLRVDECLVAIIEELSLPNLLKVDRDSVYSNILGKIKRKLGKEELLLLPKILKSDCLVGGSYAFNRATKYSDVDIYIKGDDFHQSHDLENVLRGIFGVSMEVRFVTPDVYNYLKNQGFIEYLNK